MSKPILMNTEMVRAILDGRKTVTRRVVKPANAKKAAGEGYRQGHGLWIDFSADNGDREGYIKDYSVSPCWFTLGWYVNRYAPYLPGDVLWVRETWTSLVGSYLYRADQKPGMKNPGKWRPSIHMPREAARIWLRVTDVRVEKLQAISYEDLQREGGKSDFYKVKRCRACGYGEPHYPKCDYEHCDNYKGLWEGSFLLPFMKLWDSTVKPADRERYGWAANPWVWVIEFERCEKPAD